MMVVYWLKHIGTELKSMLWLAKETGYALHPLEAVHPKWQLHQVSLTHRIHPSSKPYWLQCWIENVFGWSFVCLLSLVWMKSDFFYSKCKITWLFLFLFYFYFNLIGITNSFRQRYIYLLKLVQSSVMVITPILVVNLGLFSIDK